MKAANTVFRLGLPVLLLLIPNLLLAQAAASLSGIIGDAAGRVVAYARISVENAETGQVTEIRTDSTGAYRILDLMPGDYTVSASANGSGSKVVRVSLIGNKQQPVPVKSFDSGDSNRDPHMIEARHGAQFPIVTVRTRFPEAEITSATISADLEVQFGGQTARYQHVLFERVTQGNEVRVSGTIPATCSDFKIDRPSFLTMPVKNEIPVHVEMSWRSM